MRRHAKALRDIGQDAATDVSSGAEPKGVALQSDRKSMWELVNALETTEHPSMLLSAIAYFISIGLRGWYVEAGCPPEDAVRGLRVGNELQQVVAKQIAREQGIQGFGFPTNAFVTVLYEVAQSGQMTSELEHAVAFAMQLTHRELQG